MDLRWKLFMVPQMGHWTSEYIVDWMTRKFLLGILMTEHMDFD